MDLSSVAIVILNWNGKKFLEQFLPSVFASTYQNLRVIVADNGSDDDSIDFILQNFPSVELINNGANYGFAKGYNEALKKVKADIYVLLNSDVEITPGWIEPIIELMNSNGKIAACQPKLLNYANRGEFEYAGAAGGWIDQFGYPFAKGRILYSIEKDKGQYDEASPVFWASGAALFIRSEIFHKAGGFDEYFFAHQEEIDLCWRIQKMGYQVWTCPQSVVYHVGGGTLPAGNKRKVYLNFRNNLVMMAKNLSFGSFLLKLPVRIVFDLLAAFHGLFNGDAGHFTAIIKAYVHFLGWGISGKRKSTGKEEKSILGIYKGSIILDYYVRNKKRFSEIIQRG